MPCWVIVSTSREGVGPTSKTPRAAMPSPPDPTSPRAGFAWKFPSTVALVLVLSAIAWWGHVATTSHQPVRPQLLCQGYSACSADGYPTHGYPRHLSSSYWGSVPGDSCTNYVAYVERMGQVVVDGAVERGELGNAATWAARASSHGIIVRSSPSVGSVAQWDAGSPGVGPLGHVGIVEAVSHGGTVLEVSEQDILGRTDGFAWVRLVRGQPGPGGQSWPDAFLVFPTL